MKLSIITINLNQCAGLRETLASVAAQKFTDYEHIIIDGGSTDGSVDEIRAYERGSCRDACRDSCRLKFWISERDTGIFNAMNKGLPHADGEWLLFLNAGDSLHDADVLSDVFNAEHDADVVYGDLTGSGLRRGKHMSFPANLTLPFLYIASLPHQGAFIKRVCFNGRCYDERFRIVSDWAFFLRLFLEGCKFTHIDRTISRFNLDGVSGQARMQRAHRRERKTVLREMLTPEQRAACERELVLEHAPFILRPFLKSSRILQHAAFRCANAIRFAQARLREP